jgi:hypothetical protein
MEFQRIMAEPPAVSRRAARLWPALLALEQVIDAVTSAAVYGDVTGRRPADEDIRQLAGALRGLAASARDGRVPPPPLPDSAEAHPVAEAIRGVQQALATSRNA